MTKQEKPAYIRLPEDRGIVMISQVMNESGRRSVFYISKQHDKLRDYHKPSWINGERAILRNIKKTNINGNDQEQNEHLNRIAMRKGNVPWYKESKEAASQQS